MYLSNKVLSQRTKQPNLRKKSTRDGKTKLAAVLLMCIAPFVSKHDFVLLYIHTFFLHFHSPLILS